MAVRRHQRAGAGACSLLEGKELLAEFGLTDCRPVKTPSELKVEDDTTAVLDREEHAMYRRTVGKVVYVRRSDPLGCAVHGEGTGMPTGGSNRS